jgi:hypothetical protein
LPEATAPKEPALPTKVVPKPADAKSAAPMTAKTGEKPAPATRVGRTGLREDDEVPIPSVTPLKEDDTLRRKPTAIDPKEMAPMDGKNGRVRPIRPVSGAVVSPETALSATSLKQESILTPDFVRKGALSAGMSERLADQMAAIILGDSGQKEAITIGKDRWVLEACQSLNEYPEGERAAAFQEILRVYQRRRAAEETAKAKRE